MGSVVLWRFLLLLMVGRVQTSFRLNMCLLVGAVSRDKASSLLEKVQTTAIPQNFMLVSVHLLNGPSCGEKMMYLRMMCHGCNVGKKLLLCG